MAGCHTLLHLCKSVISVGGSSLQEASVRSVRSVGHSSPTDCTDQHRWLVALVRPRNSQNSQKFGCICGCVGTAGCHTLLHLCKSVLSVGDPSLQEASVGSVRSVGIQFSHGLHRSTQMVGCVSGCVGTAGCHTLLHLCKSVLSVGDPSLQEASVGSVRSVGIQFSHGLHRSTQMVGCVSGCVGTAGCHTLLHLCKSVLSVGDPSLQEASVGSVRSVGIQFSHGLHRSTQMVGCVSSPTESTELTEVWVR